MLLSVPSACVVFAAATVLDVSCAAAELLYVLDPCPPDAAGLTALELVSAGGAGAFVSCAALDEVV